MLNKERLINVTDSHVEYQAVLRLFDKNNNFCWDNSKFNMFYNRSNKGDWVTSRAECKNRTLKDTGHNCSERGGAGRGVCTWAQPPSPTTTSGPA